MRTFEKICDLGNSNVSGSGELTIFEEIFYLQHITPEHKAVLGNVEIVEHSNPDIGNPYDVNNTYVILSFPDDGILIKLSGTYSSYEGHELKSVSLVKPVQKMITVYEEAKPMTAEEIMAYGNSKEIGESRTVFETIFEEETIPKHLNAKIVDSYGGEGMGDQYWFILHFPDSNIHVKLWGWYQSYSGAGYNDAKIVKPVDVIKTEWI